MTGPGLLVLKAVYPRKLNWSLLQAGMPPIWSLSLENQGNHPRNDLQLRLQLPGYLDTGPMPLPAIPVGGVHQLDMAGIQWVKRDLEAAAQLTEARPAYCSVEVAGVSAQLPVGLLAPDEWCAGVGFEGSHRLCLDNTVEVAEAECLMPPGGTARPQFSERRWDGTWDLAVAAAALVQPQAPAVARIKQQALALLDAISGRRQTPLEEWACGTPGQRIQVVQAAYAALTELFPRVVHDLEKFSTEARSQRVRLPDQVAADASRGRSGATCVDYALLMCAVLESCGLEPLLVLVYAEDTCHAMTGCWVDSKHRPATALLTDVKAIKQNKALLVVDVTEFAHGEPFHQATALGASRLNPPYQFVYALDIGAARARHGIAPLPTLPGSPRRWLLFAAGAAALLLVAVALFGWLRPSGAIPLSVTLDVRVWKSSDTTRGLKLGEAGVLPLQAGDWMRTEATASRPAYLYVLYLDAEGKANPMFPWRKYDWNDRPVEKQRKVLYLPEDKDGAPLEPGPSGIESLLLLARETPLSDEENARLAKALTGPSRQGKFDPLRGAVWLGGEEEYFSVERDRARPALDKAGELPDPVERLRLLLRSDVKALSVVQRGVCYPFVGQ